MLSISQNSMAIANKWTKIVAEMKVSIPLWTTLCFRNIFEINQSYNLFTDLISTTKIYKIKIFFF